MEGKSNGRYIPPHKRVLGEVSTEALVESKFEKFLQNRGSGIKCLSEWGKRDRRNGMIDDGVYEETEMLFSKQSSKSNLNCYEDMPVEISEAFPAMMNFSDCEVHQCLLDNIKRMGYTVPTPVQRYAIPVALSRRDIMTGAQTGSGKTAAFLIPVIAKMLSERPPGSSTSRAAQPVSCVLAPTRELSIQIHEQALKCSHMSGIRIVTVYGGADPKVQSKELGKGADMIVATPGRLIDFINRGRLNLSLVKYLVIDEADMMFDMGFEPQIRTILENMKENNRETIMCSATFPAAIQDLASQFMKNYVFLAIGKIGSAVKHIKQKLYFIEDEEKKDFLREVLKDLNGLILVFVETKSTADHLNDYLITLGKKSNTIHGNKVQVDRERALNEFKVSTEAVLVATDLAARGIDVPNVSYVINYDFPNNIQDYTHRIGRTGRIGNDGSAISFLTDKNRGLFKEIYTVLCENNQEIPEWLEYSHRNEINNYKKPRNKRFHRNNY
jgi:ATP-dependent RNA helicase DDX3X